MAKKTLEDARPTNACLEAQDLQQNVEGLKTVIKLIRSTLQYLAKDYIPVLVEKSSDQTITYYRTRMYSSIKQLSKKRLRCGRLFRPRF